MLIVPMIGVLIMHDVLQNYVTMKVIVITSLILTNHLLGRLWKQSDFSSYFWGASAQFKLLFASLGTYQTHLCSGYEWTPCKLCILVATVRSDDKSCSRVKSLIIKGLAGLLQSCAEVLHPDKKMHRIALSRCAERYNTIHWEEEWSRAGQGGKWKS